MALESNPSTGYQWQVTDSDENFVQVVNDEYLPSETGLIGAPGKRVLTFEELKEGGTRIVLEYVRPWEPESPRAEYSVEVIISAES